MTREERNKEIKIILNNRDKPLNEIKRMIKKEIPIEERTKFTSENLFRLITELNQAKQENNTVSKGTRNTIKIEREER